jgi:hypothetical protein
MAPNMALPAVMAVKLGVEYVVTERLSPCNFWETSFVSGTCCTVVHAVVASTEKAITNFLSINSKDILWRPWPTKGMGRIRVLMG